MHGRFRWQFSLRALLLAMLVVPPASAWLWPKMAAWWTPEVRRSAERPFPGGGNTDAFWEVSQPIVPGDFIFHDDEFVAYSAEFAPGTKRHIEEVALRAPHVDFPIVIQRSAYGLLPTIDAERRQRMVDTLSRLGLLDVDERVVIENAFMIGERKPLANDDRDGDELH